MALSKWDANLYTEKHAFVFDYGNTLIDLLDPKNDESILDIGCGTGQLTAGIAERAKHVTGIDLSPEMIANARQNYPSLDFQIQDASNFHFEKKFDALFSNAALHWVTNYTSAINCMYAAIKKGGRIVVEFGGKGNVQTIVEQLRKSLKDSGYVDQSKIAVWYFPSIASYTAALEAAGFEVVFAQLFDRPTELADEATGIKDWLSMFAKSFFVGVTPDDTEAILSEVQEKLKSVLFKKGKWFADYRRIRIIAIK